MSSRSLAPVCRSRGDGSFLRSASTVDEQQEYLMTENDLPDELSESPPGRYRPPGYASADKRRRAIALFEAGIGYIHQGFKNPRPPVHDASRLG